MSEPDPNGVCEHGSQRRKCPHCEIVELEKELAKYKKIINAIQAVFEG